MITGETMSIGAKKELFQVVSVRYHKAGGRKGKDFR